MRGRSRRRPIYDSVIGRDAMFERTGIRIVIAALAGCLVVGGEAFARGGGFHGGRLGGYSAGYHGARWHGTFRGRMHSRDGHHRHVERHGRQRDAHHRHHDHHRFGHHHDGRWRHHSTAGHWHHGRGFGD